MKCLVWVYTFCYNEMKILPYIVKYWSKYADKVVVYDNGSDDGSKEYLEQFNWIEVRPYVTDGFNDLRNRNMKNSMWKEAREHNVDYVQVSDLDEVLYSPKDIKIIFKAFKEKNIDILKSHWIEVIADMLPTKIDNEYYHRSKGFYGNDQGFPKTKNDKRQWSKSKFILFNPNTIKESNFEVGSHFANFKKFNSDALKSAIYDNLYVFHFDKLGFNYLQYKYDKNKKRLSTINKQNCWGIQYTYSDDKKKKEIDDLMKNKIDISIL